MHPRVLPGRPRWITGGRCRRSRDTRGGGGRSRAGVQDRRLRVAQRGLLDVPRHEPGHPRARGALRLHLQPELRGAAGIGRSHPPDEPADGRGGGGNRSPRRCAGARVGPLMEPVSMVSGRMAPLDRADVDTDQIIPKQFLKRIERTGYGPFFFYDWRQQPSFFLNQPQFSGAKVLVAGANFGCGSSREHATWAMRDAGFNAVIAPSFGDIFRANSFKTGILAITLPESQVRHLIDLASEDATATVEIDVRAQQVRGDGFAYAFE